MSQPVRIEQNLTPHKLGEGGHGFNRLRRSRSKAAGMLAAGAPATAWVVVRYLSSRAGWRPQIRLLQVSGSVERGDGCPKQSGRFLSQPRACLGPRREQRQLQTGTPLESALGGNGAATSTHGLLRQAPGVQRTESGRESVVAARSGTDCLSYPFASGVHPGLHTVRARRNPGKPIRILRASPFSG